MARRHVPPFDTRIERLGPRGVGVGTAPDGTEVHVRGAPPGAVVHVTPFHRKQGVLHARRTALVSPPPEAATPRCAVFGLCGGCTLQELALDAQRRAKQALAVAAVQAAGPIPTVHAVRGAPDGYGYRNKVELSFGPRRYLSEADHAAGLPLDGRFLGFHAPGRFDRVVDATRCELVGDAANALIGTVRAHTLHDGAAPPYDVHTHAGGWRHLLVREGQATGELLVALFTTSEVSEPEVEAVATALLATPLPDARLVGVLWLVNDGVADVARGEVRAVWGSPTFQERLGAVTYQLGWRAFFQTSTEAATVLYDTIGEALGTGGTLVDLYCGAGSIGLYLASGFDQVVGIEEVPEAVEDARANAAANNIPATFHVGRVEDALDTLATIDAPRRLVVDPPRAGLHPKVAQALANAPGEVLVYVACHPASLGRDRIVLETGRWVLDALWTVDLFPQTGHVEAVARFVRRT